jgi:hypothetical protein
MKKFIKSNLIPILLVLTISTANADDYTDGIIEIGPFLAANQATHTSVGPLSTNAAFYWHNLSGVFTDVDMGYYFNSPLGNISDNETQFLSFELDTGSLFSGFSGAAMHMVISMRGNSFVFTNANDEITSLADVQLGGKGPIFHHTEGRPDGCFGIGVEDYSINGGAGNTGDVPIPLCESYQSLGFNLLDFTTYRVDVHASKGYVAYWLFRENPPNMGLNHWSLQATSGVAAPEQAIDSQGNDSVVVGTAGRKQDFDPPGLFGSKGNTGTESVTGVIGPSLTLSNVYIAKWTN